MLNFVHFAFLPNLCAIESAEHLWAIILYWPKLGLFVNLLKNKTFPSILKSVFFTAIFSIHMAEKKSLLGTPWILFDNFRA